MIRKVVDFALNNRFVVLAIAFLLLAWGAISFHNLPVEAYPDVANNYVDVITQWPGISAEQIEQQVTIPLEIAMNGIPDVVHLRSFSLFGLSDVKLIFEDGSENAWNRERVLERLAQVTLPPGVTPQMGTDWSPVGQIYFFTLQSRNPKYDVMELKSLEDWVVEKNFKSVPNVVDVASFGGPTREYQVRIDPDKLIAYGLSISQVEQQLANNNANAGGSFIEAGLQQVDVREVGMVTNVRDIAGTVIKTQNGTPLHISDIASRGARSEDPAGAIRAGHSPRGRKDHRQRRRGFRYRADAQRRRFRYDAQGDSRQGRRAQQLHSAHGREGGSIHRSQRTGGVHHAHRAAQPDRGHHPGGDHSVSVPGQYARGADRGGHHSVSRCCSRPFASACGIFPPICCRWARWISAWWWTARW